MNYIWATAAAPHSLSALLSGEWSFWNPEASIATYKGNLKGEESIFVPIGQIEKHSKSQPVQQSTWKCTWFIGQSFFLQSKIEILIIKNICLYSKASKTLWSILMKLCMRKFVMRTSWGWTCKASDRRILFENNSKCLIWISFFGIFHLHLSC